LYCKNKGKIIAKKKCRRYLAEPFMSMGVVVEGDVGIPLKFLLTATLQKKVSKKYS
jgi:hypothetical protein